MITERTPERALEQSVLRQVVAILEADGVDVPMVCGIPSISHQIVGGAALDGLHLFRLPAAGEHKSRRWRAVLDDVGNVVDLVPISTSERKRLRRYAKQPGRGR